MNTFVKSKLPYFTAPEMSFEKLFYCFVNLVFFIEFKALKDFVRVSTQSVPSPLLHQDQQQCDSIRSVRSIVSIPRGFFESGSSGKRICDDAISSPGLTSFSNIGEPLMAPCKVFIQLQNHNTRVA